jgi:hypothetical protein
LQLQVHVHVVLLYHVLVVPRSSFCYSSQSCFCCSKFTFKCCYSQLCSCCSKLTFNCYFSQSRSSTLSLHSYYLKLKILLEYFHVAYGFLIFCFVFWFLCFNLLATRLS